MSGLAAGGPGYADALETDANHAVRLQEWITSELRSQSQKFTEKHDIRVWTGTWNLNGKPPKNHAQHVREWLKPEEECDIYVLGFQEVMPLNPTNTLSVQSQALTGKWESIIDSVLNGKPLLVSKSTPVCCGGTRLQQFTHTVLVPLHRRRQWARPKWKSGLRRPKVLSVPAVGHKLLS